MAIEVISWVLEHSKSRNGARLVLIAIAERAKPNGTGAWPSIKDLMKRANLAERSVQSGIKELERIGELKVGWNKGPGGSNLYTVLMYQPPAESAPPQILHPADSAGVETETNSDTIPQDPPQNLHPAESAPPQILRDPPAESAPEPSLNRPTKKKTSSPSSATRGTRIPDDFAMTPEMITWGQENFPTLDGNTITAEFVDYWRGVAGAKGVKLDWIATWRNRVRDVAKRTATGAPGHARASPPRTTGQQRLDDAARIAADMRALDEAEAQGTYQPPILFALPPGRTA